MQANVSLQDTHTCGLCLGPLETSFFTNCGHEFDEECINGWLKKGNEVCPVCKIDVHSINPAYANNQVVDNLQQMALNSTVIINIKSLTGHSFTVKMEKNDKVIKLFKIISKKLSFSLTFIRLSANGQSISPFKYLHEYMSDNKPEYTFCATQYLGHWTAKAKNHPEIFEQAVSMTENINDDSVIGSLFLKLYTEAINNALNEVQ